MKHTLIILSALLLSMVATAQKPLLDSTQMPNAVYFLPAPPDTASAAFMYDKAQYHWGKEQRKDSTRLAIAVNDAIWSIDNICHIFSGVLGFDISEQNTPAIYRMLTIALLSTDQAGKLPKNHYMRTRPYVYYDEPTIYPQDEKWLRTNGSYPSGHHPRLERRPAAHRVGARPRRHHPRPRLYVRPEPRHCRLSLAERRRRRTSRGQRRRGTPARRLPLHETHEKSTQRIQKDAQEWLTHYSP